MPSVTLLTPGAAEKSAHPSASHDVVNRPSVVAPSVSRARNAITVATSSSGKTNDISSMPTCFCSVIGIQPIAKHPSSSIPMPKEKNPSGSPLPIGRRKMRVWAAWRLPSLLTAHSLPEHRDRKLVGGANVLTARYGELRPDRPILDGRGTDWLARRRARDDADVRERLADDD